jgi:hypothetical protein
MFAIKIKNAIENSVKTIFSRIPAYSLNPTIALPSSGKFMQEQQI